MSSHPKLEDCQNKDSNHEVVELELSPSNVLNEFSIASVTKLPLSITEQFYLPYYVSFENKLNNCWLNCALALLVNNRTLYCNLKSKTDTVLVKILEKYRDIMMEVHSPMQAFNRTRYEAASREVKCVQDLAHEYLQPLLKCQAGKPDSTFNAVMNLIGSDSKAQGLFDASFNRNLNCDNCKTVRRSTHKKTVITLPMVDNFDGSNPVSICACPACKSPNQKLYLYYQSLPPCLLFHFENGGGDGYLEQVDFQIGDRTYYLSGVITFNKSCPVPHFITWIRNPDTDQWLEYNDLGSKLSIFKPTNPKIERCTVHMLCFETFDQMGLISNLNGLASSDMPCDNADIPEIILSDDEKECAAENKPISSPSEKISEGIHNDPRTDAAQSTSTAVNTSIPAVTEKAASTVTKIMEEMGKFSIQVEQIHDNPINNTAVDNSIPSVTEMATSVTEIAEEKKKSVKQVASLKKKRRNRETEVVLTEEEKNLINMTIDNFVFSTVVPYFGLKEE